MHHVIMKLVNVIANRMLLDVPVISVSHNIMACRPTLGVFLVLVNRCILSVRNVMQTAFVTVKKELGQRNVISVHQGIMI